MKSRHDVLAAALLGRIGDSVTVHSPSVPGVVAGQLCRKVARVGHISRHGVPGALACDRLALPLPAAEVVVPAGALLEVDAEAAGGRVGDLTGTLSVLRRLPLQVEAQGVVVDGTGGALALGGNLERLDHRAGRHHVRRAGRVETPRDDALASDFRQQQQKQGRRPSKPRHSWANEDDRNPYLMPF